MKFPILISVGIFCVFAASAAKKDKNIDLTGDWREMTRSYPNRSNVAFDDTTFFHFLIGNEYTTQRKNHFMYRGTYKVYDGQLDIGMRLYQIFTVSKDEIVLKDEMGTYQFHRYQIPKQTEGASNVAGGNRGNISAGNIVQEQLPGRWEVYKRTSSETLPDIDYTTIIRVMELKQEQEGLAGGVESAKDMNGAPSWKVVGYQDGIIECKGKTDRKLKVLRCEGNELILQEGSLTYFFKKFK
ncbi:MAG: hypothetical protein JST36_03175 [Bacteroidetes bacterium]|nr:hypothetical protein [Bacteroidota bacterium]